MNSAYQPTFISMILVIRRNNHKNNWLARNYIRITRVQFGASRYMISYLKKSGKINKLKRILITSREKSSTISIVKQWANWLRMKIISRVVSQN